MVIKPELAPEPQAEDQATGTSLGRRHRRQWGRWTVAYDHNQGATFSRVEQKDHRMRATVGFGFRASSPALLEPLGFSILWRPRCQ